MHQPIYTSVLTVTFWPSKQKSMVTAYTILNAANFWIFYVTLDITYKSKYMNIKINKIYFHRKMTK